MQVLALGNDDEGQTVTAQCGTSLLELHTWLGKKQLEVGGWEDVVGNPDSGSALTDRPID